MGGAFPGRGGGRGGASARDKNQADVKRKDGAAAGRDDRRGGRLCEDAKSRDRDRSGHPRPRDGAKGRAAEGKGKVGAKGANRGGGAKAGHMACNQEVYLTAMVVPRTPVAPRTRDSSQNRGELWSLGTGTRTGLIPSPSVCPGQNHDRPPDKVPALSRSSSEGGSNRMSLSSDTEGPPPGPPQPSVPHPVNPDITEEDGEGEAPPPRQASPRQASPGLCYDAVKYTLVVEQHARLELVSLKDCFHGYDNKHKDDSDAETVYQSANEDEEPEYEEETRRREDETGGRDAGQSHSSRTWTRGTLGLCPRGTDPRGTGFNPVLSSA